MKGAFGPWRLATGEPASMLGSKWSTRSWLEHYPALLKRALTPARRGPSVVLRLLTARHRIIRASHPRQRMTSQRSPVPNAVTSAPGSGLVGRSSRVLHVHARAPVIAVGDARPRVAQADRPAGP